MAHASLCACLNFISAIKPPALLLNTENVPPMRCTERSTMAKPRPEPVAEVRDRAQIHRHHPACADIGMAHF